MEICLILIYIISIVFLIYIIYKKRYMVEGFKVSLSDNKDLTIPSGTFPARRRDEGFKYNDDVRDNVNLSKIEASDPAENFGSEGNNSKIHMYSWKKDMNYERMVSDLFGNYTDPNLEKNEYCSPPSLCKIQSVKNKFTCGCGDNIGQCFDTLSKKITGKIDKKVEEDIVEGFQNYNKHDSLNGVFYTDYGGGEKYIPCGQCQDGFIKNAEGKCEKRCANCKTYLTDQENMLLKIENDKENRFKGCDNCESCGECSECVNNCSCNNMNGSTIDKCSNCMRCKNCNKCKNKKLNAYVNHGD